MRKVKEDTRSFDLVRAIRARRLAWLGHILRMPHTRMLAKAVEHMYKNRSDGDMLTDAPKTDSWEELRAWTQDRRKWRVRVHSVRLGSKTTVSRFQKTYFTKSHQKRIFLCFHMFYTLYSPGKLSKMVEQSSPKWSKMVKMVK